MSYVLLDDHLLGDVLADSADAALRRTIGRRDIATTNLYLFRLARSALAGSGGALTGKFAPDVRRRLAQRLALVPDTIEVVPMRSLVFLMATLRSQHPLSTLGAEAIAAATTLGATLAVWEGDDGPHIRGAAAANRLSYVTVAR